MPNNKNVRNINLIKGGGPQFHTHGFNTIGSALRDANVQLRS